MIELSVHQWDLVQIALQEYADKALFDQQDAKLARELLELKEHISMSLIRAHLSGSQTE